MAFILNEMDVEDAARLARSDGRPNLVKATRVLESLVDWTNSNSDGWPYWNKPSTAATKLQKEIHVRLLGRYDSRVDEDLTDAELKAAFAPVKSFLTRQGVDHSEVFAV